MTRPVALAGEPVDLAGLGEDAGAVRLKTEAARAVAWLVIANKPFYPLYIWWLTGHGLGAAFLTALSAPLYYAAIVLGRRDTRWLRVGLPVLGMVDTILATKLLGGASGVELFAVPCGLLVAVSFVPREAGMACALAVLLGGGAVLLHAFNAALVPLWLPDQVAALVSMHVASITALSIFILFRFTRRASAGTATASESASAR